MNRVAQVGLTCILLLGCVTGTLGGPVLGQYDVRIRSNYAESVIIYWAIGNTRVGTAARMQPFGTTYIRIPASLRGSPSLRVMVCDGRGIQATCTFTDHVEFGHHGTLITVFASPTLAAMVQG